MDLIVLDGHLVDQQPNISLAERRLVSAFGMSAVF